MKALRITLIGGRLLLAGLLLWAGVEKALHPGAFAETLFKFRLLSPALCWAAAWIVPWLELSAGLGLLWRRTRRGAWLLALLLCAGFALFVFSAWIRGLDVSCGCFGASTRPVGALEALRTLALLTLALAGTWKDKGNNQGR